MKKTPDSPTKLSMSAILITAGFLLVISVTIAVSMGSVEIPFKHVWAILINKIVPGTFEQLWSKGHESIIWNIRFPRALLACLVGAGLSVIGATLQAITRNPLADPHLMGISSGAAFGAILALLHTGLFLGLFTVPLMAFVGALVATLIVSSVASILGASSADRLVLAGVAISFVIMAAANFLIFLGDPRATHTVVFWMLGGLGLAQWNHLIFPTLAFIGCSLYLFIHANELNALTIGDETAATLGISVDYFRLKIFVVSALLTGVMVAFSGMIGFVGLMIPHIVRMIVGGDNIRVLPTSALFGALFLIWADIVARKVMQPEDIPIGILTGFFGGLFFIWLLGRRRSAGT